MSDIETPTGGDAGGPGDGQPPLTGDATEGGGIEPIEIQEEMERSFLDYSMSVIVSRAAFDRIGFVDEYIPGSYAEDYEWLLRGARETGILAIQEPLVNVHWHQSSFFTARWKMIVDALTYLLEKVPEFEREPAGLARITGQIALAHAASGEPALARRWARRTIRLNWKERRAYVAMAISTRLVKVETVQKLAHASGKGL